MGISAIRRLVEAGILRSPRYRSVAYMQLGSMPNTAAQKAADLAAMFAAYDALDLPHTKVAPLNYFTIFQGCISNQTITPASVYEIIPFCRVNANGRTWMATAIYAWPFIGNSNTHTNDYGTCRIGEMLGYSRYVVYGEGARAYYPLQLSLNRAISVTGQLVTVPFDRPSGLDFSSGILSWQNDPRDGIKDWPGRGFWIMRRNKPLTVAPTIAGLNVNLAVSESLSPGDSLEVSYAYRGPGGPNPGACSGVGGNLAMVGPASVFFPGKNLSAWAIPFVATVVI
jgi:hypothetical protein